MKLWILPAIALTMFFAWSLAGQEPDLKTQDRSKFMKAKVEYSKAIVEALAMENYDLIAQKAQDLMALSNESAWNAFQTEAYITMSREFRGAAEHLREAAHSKNIDSATLAYFELTLNCVRCHKYIRQWNKPK